MVGKSMHWFLLLFVRVCYWRITKHWLIHHKMLSTRIYKKWIITHQCHHQTRNSFCPPLNQCWSDDFVKHDSDSFYPWIFLEVLISVNNWLFDRSLQDETTSDLHPHSSCFMINTIMSIIREGRAVVRASHRQVCQTASTGSFLHESQWFNGKTLASQCWDYWFTSYFPLSKVRSLFWVCMPLC